MASSGAANAVAAYVVPPPVQFQVDVVSLTNTVARLGAAELKSLQLSGVDVHTICSLLALGEVTPASETFRKKLLGCRREQRSHRWLLHAVIEYGSGTNAVVDQLLSTRAGGNVLSLIVAVTSVLDDGTVEVMNTVYQLLGASPDNTPGISQIQRVRSTCLSLARMMDFKDRVARMHEVILRQGFQRKRAFHYRDAIPDNQTMAKLVIELKDMHLERTADKKLVYYGLTGASWLVEYSKDVLGLRVCLVCEDGTIYPINGTYDTSSVVVVPAVDGEREILKGIARPTDVITSTLRSERKQMPENISWLMSCGQDGVDFFGMSCGWCPVDRQEVGNLVYSIAKEYIEHRIYLGDMEHSKQGLPYFASFLDKILQNLCRTLEILGLPHSPIFVEDWRQAHFERVGQSRWILKLRLLSRMESSHEFDSCRSCPVGSPMLRPPELATFPTFCVRCNLMAAILSTAYRASCLAFTDWAEECRMMAIGAANYGRKYFEHVYSKASERAAGKEPLLRQEVPEIPTLNSEIIGEEIITFIAGARVALDRLETDKQKFIGADFDGMLLINYRAMEPSLEPGPVFIIREG